MSWFGTDFVALGCILSGAAVGGAATLALMDSNEHVHHRCGVEAVAVSPRVAIAHGGKSHAVFVSPDVRIRGIRDCGAEIHKVVEIQLENQLEQLDVQLEHLDHAIEIQMEGLEAEIESQIEAQMDAQLKFEEAMEKIQEAKIQMVLERAGGGGV
jgi:hypothetical protein